MKKCTYCGRENDDAARACKECGTPEFRSPPPLIPSPKPKEEESVQALASGPGQPLGTETALCTACLFPNPPEIPFCQRCGAPVGFISTMGPMEHLYAEGAAYRKAAEGTPKLVTMLGMWLIFFPCLLGGLALAATIVQGSMGGASGVIVFWILLGFVALCAAMLYRVTKNYLAAARKNNDKPQP